MPKFLSNLDLNRNELQNAVLQNLGTAPTGATGQVYYDTANSKIYVYNGSSWQALSSTTGTVSLVGLALPNIFTTTNTPITSSGTISASLATQNANLIFAGPTTGAAATPSFRALVNGDLPATGAATATYGSATAIPVIGVDATGRITSATTAAISTSLSVAADTGATATVSLASDTVKFVGGVGISTAVSTAGSVDSVTIDLENTAVTTGSYGSGGTRVGTFTVDQQGRLTSASNTAILGSTITGGDLATFYLAPGNATAGITLTATGVANGAYGSATQVGTFTVDTKGRLTAAGNTSIAAATLSGDISTVTVTPGSSSTITLATVNAGSSGVYGSSVAIPVVTVNHKGLVTSVSTVTPKTPNLNEVTTVGATTSAIVTINNTTESSNTTTGGLVVSGGIGVAKNVNIGGNLTVSGNFTVNGTFTSIGVSTLEVVDPIIYLAAGNTTTDLDDIGFVGNYNDGTYAHTGLVRKATDGLWYLFSGVTYEPDGATINLSGAIKNTLVADLTGRASYGVHIVGGAAGSIPYQSGASTTAFVAAGTSGQFFKSQGTAAPIWTSVTKSDVGLGNVENTALSTWAGSTNITSIGGATASGSLTIRPTNSAGVQDGLILTDLGTGANEGLRIGWRNGDSGATNLAQIHLNSNTIGSGGDLVFSTNAGSTSAISERLRITSAGNVGIGATNPSALLEVAGNIKGTGVLTVINASDASIYSTRTGGASVRIEGAATAGYVKTVAGHTLHIGASNSDIITISPSGNVAIGSGTVPGDKLHVEGNIYLGTSNRTIYTGGNGSLTVQTGTGNINLAVNNGTNILTGLSNGNIGIGTSSPTGDGTVVHIHGTTYASLHLTNNTSGTAINDGGDLVVDGNNFIIRNREASGSIYFRTNNGAAQLEVNPSGQLLSTAGSSTAPAIVAAGDTNTGIFFPVADTVAISTGGTEAMRIWAGGSIGIGIATTPSAKLDVVTPSGTTALARFAESGTALQNLTINSTANGVQLKSSFSTGVPGLFDLVSEGGSSAITFATNGAANERMRITAGGNVGIGATAPARKLEVNGSGIAVAPLRVSNTNNNVGIELVPNSSYYNWLIGAQYNNSNTFEITPSTAINGTTYSTPALLISSAGRVGVGSSLSTLPTWGAANTYNANGYLNVKGSGEQNITLQTTDSNNTISKFFTGNTAWGMWVDGTAVKPWVIGGYQTEWIKVVPDNSGAIFSVGIGTASPGAKLDVNGTIQATGGTLSNIALTGTPTAPTASAGTSTTQIATTGFVSQVAATKTNKYAVSIGNGASTSFTVNHALNSQDVVITVREVASPYAVVYPDVEMLDVNNCTVRFSVAPTTNQFRVIVVG